MITIGDKFTIRGEKDISFRKEDGFYVSFDPRIFEIIRINELAGEVLFYISLGMDYTSISKIIKLKYRVSEEEFEKDMLNFFDSYPSKIYIKTLISDLGFGV
ncbi:MAG: hypothetical protein ABW168_04270 [Sedimenticola sp.]